MEGNVHIDLTEEIEQDLQSRYQSLCEDLTEKLKSLGEELAELCSQTQYEPMVKVVNDTIDLFEDRVYAVAAQAFNEWEEGSGSFSAAAENSRAGEAALETARQIEQKIKDLFEGFWSSHPMGEAIQVDTSRPKITAEDFDKLKEIYTKFSQEAETTSEEAVNQISEQGNENPTYNVLIPAVKAITEPVKNAFEQFGTQIDEAKEKSEELKQQQDASNAEAADAATNTAASAEEIAESLKMYDDI